MEQVKGEQKKRLTKEIVLLFEISSTQRKVIKFTALNAKSSQTKEHYKIIYAARHGEGYHNVAEAKVGNGNVDQDLQASDMLADLLTFCCLIVLVFFLIINFSTALKRGMIIGLY